MNDSPLVPLAVGAAALLVGPVRRRVLSVALITAAAAGMTGAAVGGAGRIVGAAVHGEIAPRR